MLRVTRCALSCRAPQMNMPMTELLFRLLTILAAVAAAPLGILWLVFTCRELWLAHLLSRANRLRAARDADASTSV